MKDFKRLYLYIKDSGSNKITEFDIRYFLRFIPEISFQLDGFNYLHCIFRFSLELFGIFNICIRFTEKQDHAGFMFSVSLLGLEIEYHKYDTRHWDYDLDKWEEHD